MSISDWIAAVGAFGTIVAVLFAILAVRTAQKQLSASIFIEIRKDIRETFSLFIRENSDYNLAEIMNSIEFSCILINRTSDKIIKKEMTDFISSIIAALDLQLISMKKFSSIEKLIHQGDNFSNMSDFIKNNYVTIQKTKTSLQ